MSDSFICSPLVFSKISLLSTLLAPLSGRVFDSFMYYLLMSSKISLWSKLMIPLSPMVFDSFMYYLLVFSKISLWCKLMTALSARVFDSIMYYSLMFTKISLGIKMMPTLSTRVFDSFLHCPLVMGKIRCLWESRDPSGLLNELFKSPDIGKDLEKAILKLVNGMKSQSYIPDPVKMSNITTIYKSSGSRHNLENDRGIFSLSVFRKIIDKLIYQEKYPLINKNMSNSNIGARKKRNIKNHLFIIYAIINYAIKVKLAA